MLPETRITTANQTQVPAPLRTRFGVGPGDLVIWESTPNGDVRVRFRHPRSLRQMVGMAPGAGKGDSVAAKRRAQRGGR